MRIFILFVALVVAGCGKKSDSAPASDGSVIVTTPDGERWLIRDKAKWDELERKMDAAKDSKAYNAALAEQKALATKLN